MESSGKLLITGASGQLGRDLVSQLSTAWSIAALSHADCDIRDAEAVRSTIREIHPEVVLHAAAYTDVDACESNKELALDVNGRGTLNVVQACREVGAFLVYFSTDYVFDGKCERAYYENDEPRPATVYGRSKLAGERAVADTLSDYAIIRIGWLYGRFGRNFVKTMLRLGQQQNATRAAGEDAKPIRVVNDQFGTPTWTEDVARQVQKILEERPTGLFHATSSGETSWYDYACLIFKEVGLSVDLVPCNSDEFSRAAKRPCHSSLENSRLAELGLDIMPPYRLALSRFLTLYGKELLA